MRLPLGRDDERLPSEIEQRHPPFAGEAMLAREDDRLLDRGDRMHVEPVEISVDDADPHVRDARANRVDGRGRVARDDTKRGELPSAKRTEPLGDDVEERPLAGRQHERAALRRAAEACDELARSVVELPAQTRRLRPLRG